MKKKAEKYFESSESQENGENNETTVLYGALLLQGVN